MDATHNLYIVLEVVRTASGDDIKRAFRRLARRFHPDINPGDRTAEEQFKRISEAYDVLSDPTKRRFYDEHGFYTEESPQPGTASAWGFTFKSFDLSGSQSPSFVRTDPFAQFFARREIRREPAPGDDKEYPLSISFGDSMKGFKTRITIRRLHACATCGSRGRTGIKDGAACTVCGGSGQATRLRGRLQFLSSCENCAGTGRVATDCEACDGEGRISRADVVDVEVPAGVTSGARVRIPGGGDAGRFGGPAGDLYIVANVAPHSYFTRAGDNLQCVLPVTIVEAALGAKIEVPTIDGNSLIRIPPGTQTGQVLRLREKGAPSLLQPGVRGDQFVEIRVVVPHIMDERSKEILRELARLNPDDPRKDLWHGVAVESSPEESQGRQGSRQESGKA